MRQMQNQVKISGDFLPPEGFMPGSAAMSKNEKGVWIYTSAVLAPELYSYSFLVDSFRVAVQAALSWLGICLRSLIFLS